jgi:hypothetical protein
LDSVKKMRDAGGRVEMRDDKAVLIIYDAPAWKAPPGRGLGRGLVLSEPY